MQSNTKQLTDLISYLEEKLGCSLDPEFIFFYDLSPAERQRNDINIIQGIIQNQENYYFFIIKMLWNSRNDFNFLLKSISGYREELDEIKQLTKNWNGRFGIDFAWSLLDAQIYYREQDMVIINRYTGSGVEPIGFQRVEELMGKIRKLNLNILSKKYKLSKKIKAYKVLDNRFGV